MMAAVVAAAVGCTPRSDRHGGSPLEQGRTYTAWLYQSQFQKLWDRFSPEMRQTFGSVADLASFAGRSVQQLGAEQGAVDERVAEEQPFRIYTRQASFQRARDPMLIQWSLADNGLVTGLVVRPVPRQTP